MKVIKRLILLQVLYFSQFNYCMEQFKIKNNTEIMLDLENCKNKIGILKLQTTKVQQQWTDLNSIIISHADATPENKKEKKVNLQEFKLAVEQLIDQNIEYMCEIKLYEKDLYSKKRPDSLKKIYNTLCCDICSNSGKLANLITSVSMSNHN